MNDWEIAYGTPDKPQSWEDDLGIQEMADYYNARELNKATLQELLDMAEWLQEEAYSRHGL